MQLHLRRKPGHLTTKTTMTWSRQRHLRRQRLQNRPNLLKLQSRLNPQFRLCPVHLRFPLSPQLLRYLLCPEFPQCLQFLLYRRFQATT